MTDIHQAILKALDEQPVSEVVAELTGHFVGLVVALGKSHGIDTDKEIHLDGGPNRDITIHAVK